MVPFFFVVTIFIYWLMSVFDHDSLMDEESKTTESIHSSILYIQEKQLNYWINNPTDIVHLKKHIPGKDIMANLMKLVIFYFLLCDCIASNHHNTIASQVALKNITYFSRSFDFIPRRQSLFAYPVSRKSFDSYFLLPNKNTKDYTYEWLRLQSFQTMPSHYNTSSIRLARAGFYWNNEREAIICYSCGLSMTISKDIDGIKEHALRSPGCKHVLNKDARNVPIQYDDFNQRQQETDNLNNNANTMQATASGPVHGNTHAEIHCTGSMPHTTTLQTLPASSSNLVLNMTDSRSNQSNTISNGIKTAVLSTLGINLKRPRYPEFAVLTIRISSFKGWPGYKSQTPRCLALAGFFYVGYGDYTRCFFCGGGLRNWENGDEPWVEHARWFPKCVFLLTNKSQEFVFLVQEEYQRQETENRLQFNNSPVEETSSCTKMQYNEDNLTRHPVFEQAINMGFSSEHVLLKLTEMLRAKTDMESISPATFIDSLLEHQEIAENQSTVNNSVIKPDIRSGENSAVNIENESTFENLNEAGGDVFDVESLKRNVPAISNGTKNEELLSLMEETHELRRQRECKICFDAEANIAFLPCGHLCCCSDCSSALRKCPICRKNIRGSVKALL